jgi:citrate lyase gamma subunit
MRGIRQIHYYPLDGGSIVLALTLERNRQVVREVKELFGQHRIEELVCDTMNHLEVRQTELQ